jgi:hypothetical protein
MLATVVSVLAAPAGAHALTIGIAENNPDMFSDPLFRSLSTRHVRVVVSYNVLEAARRGDDEINRVTRYINAATAAGAQPLVTFEHSRGAAEVCKRSRAHPQCKLPSSAAYERNFKAFRAHFPQVKVYAPWNEANHFTQPTSRNPRAAARFTDIAARNCQGCTIVVADILDQADNVGARKPTYRTTTRWIQRFLRSLRTKRGICGIHNYSDTNRFRDAGTKALIRALRCREYWLTETGGIAQFGAFRFDLRRQLRATRYMFKLAKANRRIRRLYVYTWFGGVTPRFDAGLVQARPGRTSQPRPAYRELKRRLTK